jgi:Mg-chelatase subunit ChlD
MKAHEGSNSEAFLADRRGGVAIMFAFALVPVFLIVGAAVDYSRASLARTDLQSAVDGAALAAGRSALDQSHKDLRQAARQAFDSGFRPPSGTTVTTFKVKATGDTLTVEAHASVPLSFGGIIGMKTLEVDGQATVPLGILSLEIALVLDNTGSMARLGKMDALKEAAKNLIDTIQASSGAGVSKIGIVPFNTQVNVGSANQSASWLRYSSGSPEPRLNVTAATWTGCVADRDQPEDIRDDLPNTGRPETLYPASACQFANLLPVMPLSGDFAGLKTAIDGMAPTGNTNTGIGLAWGLALLTPGGPLSVAQKPGKTVQKTIVFLTDGTNTENRWTTDQVQIDQRTDRICQQIKSDKIQVYTIRVIEGNETLLRNCATKPNMYFSVNQASELKGVFDAIARQLVALRLSS